MNDFFIMVNCTINNANITTLFALITEALRKGITNCNDINIFISEKIKCTNKGFEKDIFDLINWLWLRIIIFWFLVDCFILYIIRIIGVFILVICIVVIMFFLLFFLF